MRERVVQPLRTVSIDGRTSLVAYCSVAEGVRTFRLDRILAAQARPALRIPEADAPSRDDAGAASAVLRLGPGARWIAEVHGGPEAVASARDRGPDEEITVTIPVHDTAWLARLVLGAGPQAQVLSPPEAVTAVRAAAEAALAAYA